MATQVLDCVLQCSDCDQIFDHFEDFNDPTSHRCCNITEKNTKAAAVEMVEGPISELLPTAFHCFISKAILKSYVCESETEADVFRKKADPADIPVIVYNKSKPIYEKVKNNLNQIGKEAVAACTTRPWLINLLVDWSNFDHVICSLSSIEQVADNTPTPERSKDKQTECKKTEEKSNDDAPQHISNPTTPTSTKQWSKDAVLKLIELHTENDHLFSKVGYKKKSIWEKISASMKGFGYNFTGLQCEQKWKNITKNYRDTIDHNSKSGNDKKECPFFKELNEVYGFRPNVTPVYLLDNNNNNEENSDNGDGDSTVIETPLCKRKISPVIVSPNNEPKKKGNNEVLDFLKEMRDDQEKLFHELQSQHNDRMRKEDRKLDLMEKLIDKISDKKM